MKPASFKWTERSKFSATSENYSGLCLDLPRNRETEGSTPSIHIPDKFVYITEYSATQTNLTYSITVGRFPE